MRLTLPRFFMPLLAAAGGAAFLLAAPHTARAQSFSFSSSAPGYHAFVNDNDVQLLAFTLTGPTISVSISTHSYADAILNGFPTTLSLFTNTGSPATSLLIGQSIDDNGVSDATLNATLAQGSYFIALTQHDNAALGQSLSNGFAFNNSAFSDPLYTGGPFTDFDGNTRTGSWQVTANAVPVPELNSGLIFIPGILLLAGSLSTRRRRTLKGQTNA